MINSMCGLKFKLSYLILSVCVSQISFFIILLFIVNLNNMLFLIVIDTPHPAWLLPGCPQEVDPMDKESDHIHISALTSALGVGVCVEYMDRGKGGQVNSHYFPEDVSPSIHLLYRPGHYDILYPLPIP